MNIEKVKAKRFNKGKVSLEILPARAVRLEHYRWKKMPVSAVHTQAEAIKEMLELTFNYLEDRNINYIEEYALSIRVLAGILSAYDTGRNFKGYKEFGTTPIEAVQAEVIGWEFGEAKYGTGNWRKLWGTDTERVVMNSLLRHLTSRAQGVIIDEESGIPHAGLIRCNTAMLIEYVKPPKVFL